MSEASNEQQPAKVNLATAMPLTTAWVRKHRQTWGDAYVTDLIRRAAGGERNCFYAVENGHVFGAPFDWTEKGAFLVSMSVLTGAKFVAGIRDKNANTVVLQIGTPAQEVQP